MTRFTLSDQAQIVLTDASTGDTATTTKYGARQVLADWYAPLVKDDVTVGDEIDAVADAIENHSDLSGSSYLGLSIELAD